MPANADPAINGFIMEADFYKFRGRGVIQTTWRSDYTLLIAWILSGAFGANSVLESLAASWRSAAPDSLGKKQQLEMIATISSNTDWDQAFAQSITLARGVAIDSADKNGYLTSLSRNAAVLTRDRKTRGSLLYFAAHINGGDYPDRVAPMMKALICGVAEHLGFETLQRPSRVPEIATA